VQGRPAERWQRFAWAGGIVFILALVAETVIGLPIDLAHDDSADTVATHLAAHTDELVAIACVSIAYALGFMAYLAAMHSLLWDAVDRDRIQGELVMAGGVLFVTLHAVSDIGITGLLGAKVAEYSLAHDHGLSYALYYLTFALDSVGDVFGSLFLFAAARVIFTSGVLPRWLGWVAALVGILFVVQGFGLGGIVSTFGLVVDLVGFLLLLIFVLVTSVIGLRRRPA
jgi:hypothetical protein